MAIDLMIQGARTARLTGQTGAVASLLTYTPAADASFLASFYVLVTTSTVHNFTVTCAFTDESNAARTMTMSSRLLAGNAATAIINTAGAVPYFGTPNQFRAKGGTAITIATTGTFTTVTYNVEAALTQISN